jgi:hypothetical protein
MAAVCAGARARLLVIVHINTTTAAGGSRSVDSDASHREQLQPVTCMLKLL